MTCGGQVVDDNEPAEQGVDPVSSIGGSSGSGGSSGAGCGAGGRAIDAGSPSGSSSSKDAGTSSGEPCTTNSDCKGGWFCDRGGSCAGEGRCARKPLECPAPQNLTSTEEVSGVCSCDYVYYLNSCDAHADGRDVRAGGPTCLSTGQCALWDVTFSGHCVKSLGWYYLPIDGLRGGCVEAIGCTCTSRNGTPCKPEQPTFHSSQAICERSHLMCHE
jgi:hypothetical protein